MSRSAIYVANVATEAVSAGGLVPLGSAIHGYGCNITLSGSTIEIASGYFDVDIAVAITATAAGTTTVSLYQDGIPVTGATGSVVAAAIGNTGIITIPALVRSKKCCSSVLTLVLSGTGADVTNVATKVIQV